MIHPQSLNHFDSVQASLLNPRSRDWQLAWLTPSEVEGEPAISINISGKDDELAVQGIIKVRDGGLMLSTDPLYEPKQFMVEAIATDEGIKLQTTELNT